MEEKNLYITIKRYLNSINAPYLIMMVIITMLIIVSFFIPIIKDSLLIESTVSTTVSSDELFINDAGTLRPKV